PEERFVSAGDLARAASAAATAAQVATAVNPVRPTITPAQPAVDPVRPVATQQFVRTPPLPQSPFPRKGFGPGQWLLAGATFGVFVGLVGLVLWLALGQNRTEDVPAPPPTSSRAPTSAPTVAESPTNSPTSMSPPRAALPARATSTTEGFG
ncbi:MAG TPA: hypothetical protein VE666_06085, partial [Mycobacterium sp.]|nr:hypothetical protein [Mycobacterium sp.]